MIYISETKNFLIALFSGLVTSIAIILLFTYLEYKEIQEKTKPITAKHVAMKATHYHHDLIGLPMALNEMPYDALEMTCATSKMIPLGAYLKVTNMENARSIVVLVVDRHDGLTDLDLSFQAYTTLRDYDGTLDSGRIPVLIEVIP